MVKNIIQQIIIPLLVAGLVVLLSLIEDSSGILDIFLIFILPMFPLIYGRITRSKVGAILMGVIPVSGVLILILIKTASSPVFMTWLPKAIFSDITLITIIGLEGYFASGRSKLSLSVAIGLYVLFVAVSIYGCLG